tara:strand:- start:192 stop:476 length:285 start_codon:yes stop_codon:yes gene_type:complete
MSKSKVSYIWLGTIVIVLAIYLVYRWYYTEGMMDSSCHIGSLLDPETLRLSQTLPGLGQQQEKKHTGVSINFTINRAPPPKSKIVSKTGVTPLV